MIPVVAAIIVPIIVTERASPPGVRRSKTWRQCRRSFATPERSNIVPIKINIGTATKIKFSAAVPQIREITLKK